MTPLYWILGFIAFQRLGELAWARRNTAALLTRGGREVGAGHYRVMVAMHTAWLVSMAVFIPADTQILWPAFVVFVVLQCFRIWVIWALGPYWTTRVITVDDAPLVRRGPYRWFRHPNYGVVSAEIAMVPLIFLAWEICVVFTIVNIIILKYRINIEEAVLRARE